MGSFLVIGGRQKKDALKHRFDEWHHYQCGVILQVDSETGQVRQCVEYVSPPEACPSPSEKPSITFKAASRRGDTLYVCTQTEIILYSLPGFQQIGYVSLPCFNDVHHVLAIDDDRLLVANTGLDMIVEVTLAGEMLNVWSSLGKDPWHRFSPDVDYRKVLTTKPHHSHPNYVFQYDSQFWCTRFEQSDAICLNDNTKRISIDIQKPHDGLLYEGLIYFTTVDGHIVITDPDLGKPKEIINLNEIDEEDDRLLGWCRGIMVENKQKIWTGFSRLRPTKFRENLSWVKQGFKKVWTYNTHPTHIGCYDVTNKQCLQEINIEKHNLNAIFDIIPFEESP